MSGQALCRVLCAVSAGTLWALVLWARFSHQLKFDRSRSEMDELQAPISDSAFYLSYYYDVVRAPSLLEGLQRLLADARSEAPETVNALHKFNVMPELLVAMMHSMAFRASAFGLYVSTLIVFTGCGVAALALTSSLLGGALSGPACAALYASLCFGGDQVGTRLGGASMALREHWGLPAMLIQNLWLSVLVMAPEGRCSWRLFFCAAGTCILELCWQFAPFLLLLQTLAALGVYFLDALSLERLGQVTLSLVTGTGAALLLSFGNRMLLCSPFLALASSIYVVCWLPWSGFLRPNSVLHHLVVLLASLVLGVASHQSLAVFAGEEDRHVLQLLLQKLGLAPPEASFDAFLYLQAPEFQFLSYNHIREATTMLALPFAGLAALLVALNWLRGLAGSRGSRSHKQGARLLQIFFTLALCLVALLVSRLRVLAAPALCLAASLCASPDLLGGLGRPGVVLAHGIGLLLLSPLQGGVVARAQQVSAIQDDLDMRELVEWANATLGREVILLADMTMAAKLRMISPHLRVGNHPQYESLTSRQRNRDYYRTFSCASPARVFKALRRYNVTHVVLNANACRARMGKLDPFVKKRDRCGDLKGSELQHRSFCWAGFLTEPPGFGPFRLEFRNPVYTVLSLNEHYSSLASRKEVAWEPWLEGVQAPAARGLARAAASANGLFLQAAELQLQKAEALAPEDPVVVLSRGRVQQQRGQAEMAFQSMSRAADLAAGISLSTRASRAADSAALYQVYLLWKNALNERGAQASGKILKNLAKSLLPFFEATHNAWELCDIASWLKDWGDQKVSQKLWEAAKRSDPFDSCVREDWSKWEVQPPPGLAAFLR
ncbi:unnamed protein product [Effrenium voratum]|nr:unnamed protein product [Effrenium voratum]